MSPLRALAWVVGITLCLNVAAVLGFITVQSRNQRHVETAPAQALSRDEGALRAQRQKALEAVTAGDYDTAIALYSELSRGGKGWGDEPGLIAMANELKARKADAEALVRLRESLMAPEGNAKVHPERRPHPSRAEAKVRREAAALRPVRSPPRPHVAEVASSREGQLWIISEPKGLTVDVNGIRYGPAPQRMSMKPGNYLIEVFQGDQKAGERRVFLAPEATELVEFSIEAEVPPTAVSELPKAATSPPAN
jgi:hypothetical protein